MSSIPLRYKLTSSVPMIVHSDRTVNPFDPITIQLKELTSKRKKTHEDLRAIARLEFLAAVYWNEDIGYHIPANVIEKTFENSAKQFKLGTLFKQAVLVLEDAKVNFPDAKLAPAKLYDTKPEYRYERPVVVNKARINRTRAIIPKWTAEIIIYVDTDKMNEKEADQIVTNAGSYIGMGNLRPRFGRFTIEKIN